MLLYFFLRIYASQSTYYYIQQNLHYATYREKRLKLTASGVTLTGSIENSTSTLITRQLLLKQKKGTIESLHLLWNDC